MSSSAALPHQTDNEYPRAASGRAILWMVPRTVSTALAKCMSGIPDCEVWIEPYFYCYLASKYMERAGIEDPPMSFRGHEAEFRSVAPYVSARSFTPNIIPERLAYETTQRMLEESPSKYVFNKDESIAMTSSAQRQYLPRGYRHSFLIRHPILVYDSLRRTSFGAFQGAGMLRHGEDEGSFDMRKYDDGEGYDRLFQHHRNLWAYIREKVDPSPAVMSSDDLLQNPAKIMSKYCDVMGFPYTESLLKWDASPDVCKSWKVSADRFNYNESFVGSALSSSGFGQPKAPPAWDQLTDDVRDYVGKAMPFYDEMLQTRLM